MPQHKRGPWSATEDQYLLHLVQLHGAHNWVRISSAIQTRSPKQCRERFHQNLKPNLNHDPITPEEGILIEQMVAEMGKRWAEIARRLHGRSDNAVKNWWNGGMNRRKRGQNQRRSDPDLQHQPQQPLPQQLQPLHQQQSQHISPHHQQQQQQQQHHHAQQAQSHMQPMGLVVPPAVHHPAMANFQNAATPFFTQPIYHHPNASMHAPSHQQQHPAQHMSVPSNAHMFHRNAGLMIEPPLPSPSTYSQLSADGPPSLVSDCSSTRSPNNGASPIELPPISGPGSERRHSSNPMIRVDVPNNGYMPQNDFQMHMQMKQHQQQHQQHQPMLQDAFQPQPSSQHMMHDQHQFAMPSHMVPSQLQRATSMQQMQMQAQQQHHFLQSQQQYQIAPHLLQRDLKSTHPSVPSTPAQLPRLSRMPTPLSEFDVKTGLPLDPALQTPTGHHTLTTPDGSPKDKMSLSNLTH